MIKIYGMKSCVHCQAVERQIVGDDRFEFIDIGAYVGNMKEFIRLRDQSSVFDEAKAEGYIGIPCFVLEDGTITISPEDVGLLPNSDEEETEEEGDNCSIDGKGC